MVSSKASTVESYLSELPDDRREAIAAVRDLVNRHLPDGYVETMNWGMISWEIPLSRYPVTYNKQPLAYAALAAQKNHLALYLMGCSDGSAQGTALREAYARAGKKLDIGKCCLRFKRWDDLVPEAVGAVIASTPVDVHIAQYETSRARK